ncbi:LuxR C-terminal-related transcriptional regulator [Acetivibrio mesophilus]|uniref:LuxR C-terminal-related transcriptional regulator n=1 Tax=Acetivibrio mesophilus TaxID=2487273 RepID=UPI0038B2BFE6
MYYRYSRRLTDKYCYKYVNCSIYLFLFLAINAYKSKTINLAPDLAQSSKSLDTKTQINLDDICNQYCLSEREKLIVEKLIQGASNKEIAEKLYGKSHYRPNANSPRNYFYTILAIIGVSPILSSLSFIR